jgi:hypothetical protein
MFARRGGVAARLLLLSAILGDVAQRAQLAGKRFLGGGGERHLRGIPGEHLSPRDHLHQIPLASRGHEPREEDQPELETMPHDDTLMSVSPGQGKAGLSGWLSRWLPATRGHEMSRTWPIAPRPVNVLAVPSLAQP